MEGGRESGYDPELERHGLERLEAFSPVDSVLSDWAEGPRGAGMPEEAWEAELRRRAQLRRLQGPRPGSPATAGPPKPYLPHQALPVRTCHQPSTFSLPLCPYHGRGSFFPFVKLLILQCQPKQEVFG